LSYFYWTIWGGKNMCNKKECKKCIIDIETKGYLPWDNSQIICIGLLDIQTKTKHVFHNLSEEKLIHSFINFFNTKNFDEIIGYNIAYDVRFLLSRCLKYQINAKNIFDARMIDLMRFVSLSIKDDNFNKPGKLGEWSAYLFKKTTLYQNGSILELYSKGKIDEIIAHNHRDLDLTYSLWHRIVDILFKEGESL
jgi:DNA polymerase elongation subunit (family B)